MRNKLAVISIIIFFTVMVEIPSSGAQTTPTATPMALATPIVLAPSAPPSAPTSAKEAKKNASSLPEALTTLGATLAWDPISQIGILQRGGHRISFRVGFDEYILDYSERKRLDPIIFVDGSLSFSQALLTALASWFDEKIADDKQKTKYRVATIILDPGHGGKDAGASKTQTIKGKKVRLIEKDITLDIAKKLYDKLTAAYPDKKIIMTRSDDSYVSLDARVDIANTVKLEPKEAIVFVSIHANWSYNADAKGYEIWYLPQEVKRDLLSDAEKQNQGDIDQIKNILIEDEFMKESIYIANFMIKGLGESMSGLTESRGIKEESWFVVRNAKMPAVLVEVGFMTNEDDAMLLSSSDYLQKFAEGLYTGLQTFIVNFEK